MAKVTFDTITSKAKQYRFEIVFILAIIIFSAMAKTIANFILDYRVVIIIIAVLWYLGYMNRVQQSFKEKLLKINYFQKWTYES